jgi:hypothetical protein
VINLGKLRLMGDFEGHLVHRADLNGFDLGGCCDLVVSWWSPGSTLRIFFVAEDAAPCHLGPSIDWPDFQFRSLKDGWKIRGGGYPMVIHGKGRFPMQNWLDISTCRIKARAAMSCSMLLGWNLCKILGPNYGPGRFKPLRQSKTDSIPVASDMTILPPLS